MVEAIKECISCVHFLTGFCILTAISVGLICLNSFFQIALCGSGKVGTEFVVSPIALEKGVIFLKVLCLIEAIGALTF